MCVKLTLSTPAWVSPNRCESSHSDFFISEIRKRRRWRSQSAGRSKSHSATGVSSGMKGLMGLIWDRESFHSQYNISQAVADLATVVKLQLTILTCGTGLKLFRGRDFPPPLIFRRIIDLLHDFGVKQEGKGLDLVDYNPETSHQDISCSIVRKSSIRPSFESLDLTQRPKILEATYLATSLV